MLAGMVKRTDRPLPDTPETVKTSRRRVSTPSEYVRQYIDRFRFTEGRLAESSSHGRVPKMGDAEILRDLLTLLEGADDRDASANCAKLRAFVVAYGVSRTFAGLSKKPLCLQPVVAHLLARKGALQGGNLVHEVEELADACVQAGFHRNLSFASKCLCMLGHLVPIFSSEAVAYLRSKGALRHCKAGDGYEEFYYAWWVEYEKERMLYEASAAHHLAHGEGMAEEHEVLECRLGIEWFAMRGYDVKLMAQGAPLRSK
ncbi:MAG: hypothetical protein SGPRY_001729 [Prymnesium sp.]